MLFGREDFLVYNEPIHTKESWSTRLAPQTSRHPRGIGLKPLGTHYTVPMLFGREKFMDYYGTHYHKESP